VLIRDAVGSMSSEFQDFKSALDKVEQQRQDCLRMMGQYTKDLQNGIMMLISYAKQMEIRSMTRLEDVASIVTTELTPPKLRNELNDGGEPLSALENNEQVDESTCTSFTHGSVP
jgi:hypothetical protein